MKSKNTRVQRYREEGSGAGLVRVEVLVPPQSRQDILGKAAQLRASYRAENNITTRGNLSLNQRKEKVDGWNQ